MALKPWECNNDEYLSPEDKAGLQEFQGKVDESDEWNEVYADEATGYKVGQLATK